MRFFILCATHCVDGEPVNHELDKTFKCKEHGAEFKMLHGRGKSLAEIEQFDFADFNLIT